MGVDACAFRFLTLCARTGVDFSRTLMLGRQNLNCARWEMEGALRDLHVAYNKDTFQTIQSEAPYAEGYFRWLGATDLDSMDASDYEHATLVHSLNDPIPTEWEGRYSAVFDGGTLEHVFDVRQAWGNAMSMVRPGGHFVGITTSNNYLGHGFYQFSPELIFRMFTLPNGFELEGVFIYEEPSHGYETGELYEVADPAALRRRVTLLNAHPTFVVTRARRLSTGEPFTEIPIQSDYTAQWEAFVPAKRRRRSVLGEQIRMMRFQIRSRLRFWDRLKHGLQARKAPDAVDKHAFHKWKMDVSMEDRWKPRGPRGLPK